MPDAPYLPARVVCASANAHKVAEMSALLGGVTDMVPRPASMPDVVEDAGTLEGNARLKAVAVAAFAGMPALSDDTGLFVDALDGQPGVDTAYFAGPSATGGENRALLLERLRGAATRTARFRTVVVVAWPDGRELLVDGVCEGAIAPEERGDRGFGYDPVFIPADGDGRTFAEMSAAEKNAVSHRSRAFAALRRHAGPAG
ncbi:MAG: RdgB/HAM1 family non-canonical purine NTP pyrophosphatase [Ilumatobacteraceae bacterium]